MVNNRDTVDCQQTKKRTIFSESGEWTTFGWHGNNTKNLHFYDEDNVWRTKNCKLSKILVEREAEMIWHDKMS
jgi:hypothetical protein